MATRSAFAGTGIVADMLQIAILSIDTAVSRSAVGFLIPYDTMVSDFAGYG